MPSPSQARARVRWSPRAPLEMPGVATTSPREESGSMTRTTKLLASLVLAAATVLAGSVQASELALPGEPEFDQRTVDDCDRAVPSDEPLARGRIVAVDPKAGRITLDFQPIL